MNFSPCRCYDKEFHIPPNEPIPFVCLVKPEKKLAANYSESCCTEDLCNDFSKLSQNLTHLPETPGKHGTTLMCNAKNGEKLKPASVSRSCHVDAKLSLNFWKVVWLVRNDYNVYNVHFVWFKSTFSNSQLPNHFKQVQITPSSSTTFHLTRSTSPATHSISFSFLMLPPRVPTSRRSTFSHLWSSFVINVLPPAKENTI